MLDNIIHKKYNFNNYNIETVDNIFSLDSRLKYYSTFKKSNFYIGWEDTSEIEVQHYKYLHSIYNEADLRKLGLVEDILLSDFGKRLFDNYNIKRGVLNLSKPGDFYLNHTHGNDTVLLYYANIRWQEEWSGETLFFNDSMKEILFATPYIPGRIVLFDGKIPHTIRSQSIIAPHYRFTFTLFLAKK